MTREKIKVVLLMPSMLNKRWVDFYCLDTLAEQFDVEYWDCSAFTNPSFKYPDAINSPYLKVLPNKSSFKEELANLPKDTLICIDIHYTKENYALHRIISRFFKEVIVFSFWDSGYTTQLLAHNAEVAIPHNKESAKKSIKKRIINIIKKKVNRDSILFVCGQIMHHPSKSHEIIRLFYQKKCEALYTKVHVIGAAPYREYYINLPDVERYLAIWHKNTYTEKFVVFVDAYMPYHPDLKIFEGENKLNQLAEEYFSSMNGLFATIEASLDCKVIIATHPSANYTDNPFNGRDMIKNQTGELIRDSIGVIMHNSGSLSYVILFDKPILLTVNSMIKQMDWYYEGIQNVANLLSIPLYDIDNIQTQTPQFIKVSVNNRQKYMKECMSFEEKHIQSNVELIPKILNDIYARIYGK